MRRASHSRIEREACVHLHELGPDPCDLLWEDMRRVLERCEPRPLAAAAPPHLAGFVDRRQPRRRHQTPPHPGRSEPWSAGWVHGVPVAIRRLASRGGPLVTHPPTAPEASERASARDRVPALMGPVQLRRPGALSSDIA